MLLTEVGYTGVILASFWGDGRFVDDLALFVDGGGGHGRQQTLWGTAVCRICHWLTTYLFKCIGYGLVQRQGLPRRPGYIEGFVVELGATNGLITFKFQSVYGIN